MGRRVPKGKQKQQKQILLSPLQLSEKLMALEEKVNEMKKDHDHFKKNMINTFKLTNGNVQTNIAKLTKLDYDFRKFEKNHPDLFQDDHSDVIFFYSVNNHHHQNK